MARGRKHGSNHPERLLGNLRYGQGHKGGADLPDLREEDVWSFVATDDARSDSQGTGEERFHGGDSWRDSGGDRRDRDHDNRGGRTRQWLGGREDRPVGGLSLAFEDENGSPLGMIHQYRNVDSSASSRVGRHHHVPSSAPLNVPDWPKILQVDSSESLQGQDGYGDDDGEWVPPHEYLAREYAKSGRAMANSVFEGVGRTLKGRDMRRVRDAVWSQTGFFG